MVFKYYLPFHHLSPLWIVSFAEFLVSCNLIYLFLLWLCFGAFPKNFLIQYISVLPSHFLSFMTYILPLFRFKLVFAYCVERVSGRIEFQASIFFMWVFSFPTTNSSIHCLFSRVLFCGIIKDKLTEWREASVNGFIGANGAIEMSSVGVLNMSCTNPTVRKVIVALLLLSQRKAVQKETKLEGSEMSCYCSKCHDTVGRAV